MSRISVVWQSPCRITRCGGTQQGTIAHVAVLKYRDPTTGEFVPVVPEGPPVGVIIAYTGADIPEGWHLCDGSVHGSAELQAVIGSARTPDLRDRFVVGAGATMPRGSTGGVTSVRLTSTQTGTPAHNHTASTGSDSVNHTHPYSTGTAGSHTHSSYISDFVDWSDLSNTANNEFAAMSNASKPVKSYSADGSHKHGGTTGNVSTNHTHSMAANPAASDAVAEHNNLPPFFALVYLIKTE